MRNALLGLALLTGISAVATAQTPLTRIVVGSGFTQPTYVTSPTGDFNRLFVMEQRGIIKIIKNGTTLPTPFLDISSLVRSPSNGGGNEQGLLGLAFHPDYFSTDTSKSGGYFYVYYTNLSGNNVLARYLVAPPYTNDTAAPVGQILLTFMHPSFTNHNGGNLNFGPDGYLYLGTGDGGSGNDPNNNAQNVNSYLGKIHRLKVGKGTTGIYDTPPNNPFVGVAGLDEIFAIGVRNPWRWSFDRTTGAMYIGEVGQDAVEEVDYLEPTYVPTAGGTPLNFGWRCKEGNNNTNLAGCVYPNPYPGTDVRAPIWTYTHSTGFCVIGGYSYGGSAVPDLRGTFFFADNATNKIWSFKYSGSGAVPSVTDRTSQLNPGSLTALSQITSFGQDAAGEMYIVSRVGTISKIIPTAPVLTGYANYGTDTPGCSGSHGLTANLSPVIGNPIFKLTSVNAPASTLGLLLVGNASLVPAVDVFSIGVPMNVDLFLSTEVYPLDMPSDGAGVASTTIPIPNVSALIGLHYYGMSIFPSACGSGLSGSVGGDITILP